MEDFNGLASSLAAGVGDVRGCLILSGDGLVLGAHPDGGESTVKPAWMRFAALGDPERGFAQFGTETWCYVRRGPYAAFAMVGASVRPGLVIDHMEQVLLAAEETRNSRRGVREGAAPPEPLTPPTTKPRTTLHPEIPAQQIPAEVPEVLSAEPHEPTSAATPAPPPAPPREPALEEGPASPWATQEGDEEGVDRLALTKELGRLLQEDSGRADG